MLEPAADAAPHADDDGNVLGVWDVSLRPAVSAEAEEDRAPPLSEVADGTADTGVVEASLTKM